MWRLLDTNIVSFVVKRHTLATTYQPHLSGFDLAIAAQTWGELLAWGLDAGWGPVRWRQLDSVVSPMTMLDATKLVTERWAEVWHVRRAQPIGVADAWIAATALAHNLELVTHNPADFAGIPGLAVITEAP